MAASARRHHAIGFGCDISHAADLVYSDGIDLRDGSNIARIGVSCRICERLECHQRAFPPYDASITVDPHRRAILPYRIDGISQRS
ncbi:short-chain fatty acyl-CoA regulator family protein [Lichenifustis flavocetrariae]|uniref:short-chain fatty acyl-CoA regulator family protein n=1 Tax=Lichenifustis flavocetrariae TaxID=2949735 RepID=UPI003D1129B8